MTFDQPTVTLLAAIGAFLIGILTFFKNSLVVESNFKRNKLSQLESLLAELIPLLENRNSYIYFNAKAEADRSQRGIADAALEQLKPLNIGIEIERRRAVLKLRLDPKRPVDRSLIDAISAADITDSIVASWLKQSGGDFSKVNAQIQLKHDELWESARSYLRNLEHSAAPRMIPAGSLK